jgi:hypothetical protein
MGYEAKCVARLGARSSEGKARLETSDLTFRGTFRLDLPFAEIRSARAADGELIVEYAGGPAVLELGAAAERWAKAITRPKGRLEKLGVKPGLRIAVLGVGDPTFAAELAAQHVEVSPATTGAMDLVLWGAETRADLARLPEVKRLLADAGALWVVRPKGRPEITESEVFAAGKKAGLVDVKVVAFSASHTAEKFVIPVAKRAAKAAAPAQAAKPAAASRAAKPVAAPRARKPKA